MKTPMLSTQIFELLIKSNDEGGLRNYILALEIELIRRRGHRDGENAGGWMLQEYREDPLSALALAIKGIEDGDPMILDQLPSPRLGGEFADDPTWEGIIEDELNRRPSDDGDQSLEEEYRQAFDEGLHKEIYRAYSVYVG